MSIKSGRLFIGLVIAVVFAFAMIILSYSYRGQIRWGFNSFLAKEKSDSKEVNGKVTLTDKTGYWGIDISHHQTINWDQLVSRNRPGFIFMKATEGSTHTDSRYNHFRKKAREHNIPAGAYHFFSYQSPGKKQAQHFIRHSELQTGDLLPVLDVEYMPGKEMPDAAYIKTEIAAFCQEIISEFGVKPIIYCEAAFYRNYLNKGYEDYPLWISDLHREPTIRYDFWQYTDKGMVHGIGKIDNNRLREGLSLSKYMLK